MKRVIYLAMKDLKLRFRDKPGFFFSFIFPLTFAVLFGAIYGGDGGEGQTLSLAVVDLDGTPESRAFIAELDSAPELSVTLSDLETARENVRRGRIPAYISLGSGFGEATRRIFWGGPPEIELGVDPARKAEAAMLQGILMKYASERLARSFSNPAMQRENVELAREYLRDSPPPNAAVTRSLEKLFSALAQLAQIDSTGAAPADLPRGPSFRPLLIRTTQVAVIRRGPTNAYEVTFPQGIIWGIVGLTAAFGLSIVTERTRGTLLRLRSSPLSLSHILAGKALACFLAILLVSLGLLLVGVLAFGIRIESPVFFLLAAVCSSICFSGLMMLLSVLGKTEHAVGGISWAILLIMTMLGGGMIPLFIMPGWMRAASNISPVKWSITAMEGAAWRGFSLSEMLLPYGVLLAIGLVSFAAGTMVFKLSVEE